MSDLRKAAQQALEALEDTQRHHYALRHAETDILIAALRAALAEPTVKESLTTGSCIACGNRITGSPESFVVATAEVGVTAPEGYSPQQVEALSHKGGDKTSPPLAEPVQEPVAWMYTGIKSDGSEHGPHLVWRPEYMDAMSASKGTKATPLYTFPPQRKPLTDEQISDLWHQSGEQPFKFARMLLR